MLNYKVIQIKNGDYWQDFIIYKCNQCNKEVPENHPHHKNKNNLYCWDCAFKKGYICANDYVRFCGISLDGIKAAVHPSTGEIEITDRKRFSWEMTPRQQGDSKE